jgi:mono/diheme cytochrome c family protein
VRNFIAGILTGLIAAILAVWLYPWNVAAATEPTVVETWLMTRLLERGIRRGAPQATNPLEPSDEMLLQGMKFYVNGCAGCHGDGKQRSTWGTTSFFPRVPQFGTHAPSRPDWQIFWIVKYGIRNTGMGGWAPLASDEELWKVAAFVSRIDSLPPAVAASWRGDAP